MTGISEIAEHWFGLCRKAPGIRTRPAVLRVPHQTVHADRPDGSGPSSGRSGRVRQGISIAAESLNSMVRSRYLLGFSIISGLVMFFLIVAEDWDATHLHDTLPFTVTISAGSLFMVLDPWIFLAEMICLFCFTLLLTDLLMHRNGDNVYAPVTIREKFSGVGTRAGPLAVLSITLALIATMGFGIVTNSLFFTMIADAIVWAFFWIPYEFVISEMGETLYFAFIIMVISIIPFLIALCLVPVIVREEKGLVPSLAGSIASLQRTWREILGCILVYGIIILGIAAAASVIGQVPEMLIEHGYHLSMYFGHMLMPVVYYGFILACLIMMDAGFSAAGVALAKLYRMEESGGVSGGPEGTMKKTEPAL